jgi:hypothetical protein
VSIAAGGVVTCEDDEVAQATAQARTPDTTLIVRKLCSDGFSLRESLIVIPNCVLKLKLKTRLEELRLADKAEAVERTIPIGHLEPHVVGEIPVHHRREPPELAALQ